MTTPSGLEPTDPFVWSGKGIVLCGWGPTTGQRAFDKALSLNPALESAAREEIADESAPRGDRPVRHQSLGSREPGGAEISKEDAFRECDIPYSHLDEVFAFLEEPVSVSVGFAERDGSCRSTRRPRGAC